MQPEETSSNDLRKGVFDQLMENSRNQDKLIHSWTKYFLSIQSGLAVALAFLVELESSNSSLFKVGTVFLPLLGIVTAVCLTNIILRELMWQGRYMAQINRLPEMPEALRGDWVVDEPDPKKRGYIGNQFWWLRVSLVAGWSVWLLVSLSDLAG